MSGSPCESCNQMVDDEVLQYDLFGLGLLCQTCTELALHNRKVAYRDWYAPHWVEWYGSIETRNQWNETFEEWLNTVI